MHSKKNYPSANALLWCGLPREAIYCLVALGLFLASSGASLAAVVELRLSPQLTASAEYQPGKSDKPALILLHGFLQTREFPTIQRLAQGLAEQGYATLIPTLSLGVPKRVQTLPCEAIHNHSFEKDVAELSRWETWLSERGHKNIVLIGHSFGSLQVLAEAALPTSIARKVIALSLVDTREVSKRSNVAVLHDATAKMRRGDKTLFRPPFAYCKEFPTTAANYVSYASWDRMRILRLVKTVKKPTEIIMGSNDNRMGTDWPAKLRSEGASVRIIEGANHFFDDEHEFDLLDAVLTALK